MDRQVFQTDSKSRWRKFKWGVRIPLVILALLILVFIAMLAMEKMPYVPFTTDYKGDISATKPYLKKNSLSNEYNSARKFFTQENATDDYAKWARMRNDRLTPYPGNGNETTQKYIEEWSNQIAGIRAAFYVTWGQPQSYASLKESLGKLNMVVPEWFVINPKTAKVENRMDAKAYNLMSKSGIPIIPMLSNAYANAEFSPEGVEKILHDPILRKATIDNLVKTWKKYKFTGINIDFEELTDTVNEPLTTFVRELALAFHEKGLYVTQDVSPFNMDYDVRTLSQYVDYMFLMAYDQHNGNTPAGDVSAREWIGRAVDDLAFRMPEEKIVLCLAAYGYDWTKKGDDNQTLTYHGAVALAADTHSHINFNEDSYGLNFRYMDDQGVEHEVYFNDAVTNFNAMRFGTEHWLAGFGLWRLGSEDERIWLFYNRDMTHYGAADFDVVGLKPLSGSLIANYFGTGEVLDVIATPHPGRADIEVDSRDMLISNENYIKIPTGYELRKFGHAGQKELLLTFDDGPDRKWTPRILNILKRHNIHAAFFMVGLQVEKNLPVVRRMYNEGHLLGNHTFTHPNLYTTSPARTFMELKLTRLLIECVTGNSTILFRAPYNAVSDPTALDEVIPIVKARKQNYLDVGEAIDPEDWKVGITAEQIYKNVMAGVADGYGHIILLHDAGGKTREETVRALPMIIDSLQERGYKFIDLTKYLGRTKAQLMPPVPRGKEYYAMQANLTLAEVIYNFNNFITAAFIVFLVIGIGRLVFMGTLAVREASKYRGEHFNMVDMDKPNMPLVSVIVPAYNEEVDAVGALENLLRQDYPNFNVVFVNDGSKDNTYQRVREALGGNPKLSILTKPNGGKASALNYGIARTEAEYLVCIDADTKLYHNAITLMIRHFLTKDGGNVGAVAGNVKVGNICNILTRWQSIEYTTSQNFDRMAYAAINAITVVPGAIGAFRKEAIEDAGGLSTDTLAEDCDLTMRILKAGYKVDNENHAIAMTEAPEKMRQFIKQRTRWSFGIMQTFWKHHSAMFNRKYKGLGMWALPNMLIFQFIIPTFSPIADVLMLLGLFSGSAGKVLLYYAIFLLVDSSVSIMAYIREREKLWVLLWIIPQRLCYRWIMYVVLFKSYRKAIKGELQTWGVLKRTGKVADV